MMVMNDDQLKFPNECVLLSWSNLTPDNKKLDSINWTDGLKQFLVPHRLFKDFLSFNCLSLKIFVTRNQEPPKPTDKWYAGQRADVELLAIRYLVGRMRSEKPEKTWQALLVSNVTRTWVDGGASIKQEHNWHIKTRGSNYLHFSE